MRRIKKNYYEKMFKKNFNKDWKSWKKRIAGRKFKDINHDFDKSFYRKFKSFDLFDYC